MLQVIDDVIRETPQTTMTVWNGHSTVWTGGGANTAQNCYVPYYQELWHSYPVYVCTDKTKKAIEVLKALEADGLQVTSVPKFIALVEKIAGIL